MELYCIIVINVYGVICQFMLYYVCYLTFKGKEWGNTNGDPVIGLHGWVDNCATFDRLAPLLPLTKIRFIALDFPGHGHSSHLPPGRWYSWTDYLGSVIRSVNHLKLDKFSFIAHSMGGKIAYLYAGMYPDKVKRMVALDVHRPFPGTSLTLLEHQDGLYNDWDYTKIYKSFYNHLLKMENGPTSKSTAGQPMDEMVKKTLSFSSDLNFMNADSARIILKRGTRQVNKDPELYVLTRDSRLRVYDMFIHDSIVVQFIKNMMCDLLVVEPENGILSISTIVLIGDLLTQFYKEKSCVYKVVSVKGYHHEHLNGPDKMAPIISKFLLTSQ